MKKLILTGLVVGIAALGAPVAQAAPNYDYRGGCSFVTLNDTTPGSVLGGQNVWNGIVEVDVRAVNNDDPDGTGPQPATPAPTTAISVNCELVINAGSPTVVLSASGTGAAGNVDQIQFTAASGSVVQLCDNVTVGGEHIRNCGTSTETPVVPQPVQDLLTTVLDTLFNQVLIPAAEQIDAIIATIVGIVGPIVDPYLAQVNEASKALDPVICAGLIAASGAVNLIDPTLIWINPATGDTYLFGDGPASPPNTLFWDCPPYVV